MKAEKLSQNESTASSIKPNEIKGEDTTKKESPTRRLELTSKTASEIRDDVAILRGMLEMMFYGIVHDGDLQSSNYASWVIYDALDHVRRLGENLKGVEDII
jgi:hypothetical protein